MRTKGVKKSEMLLTSLMEAPLPELPTLMPTKSRSPVTLCLPQPPLLPPPPHLHKELVEPDSDSGRQRGGRGGVRGQSRGRHVVQRKRGERRRRRRRRRLKEEGKRDSLKMAPHLVFREGLTAADDDCCCCFFLLFLALRVFATAEACRGGREGGMPQGYSGLAVSKTFICDGALCCAILSR